MWIDLLWEITEEMKVVNAKFTLLTGTGTFLNSTSFLAFFDGRNICC